MKKITIVIVGNTQYRGMRFAIEQTLNNTPDVETVLEVSKLPLNYGTHIHIKEEFNLNDYNHFMIKNLWAHINTEFVLIVQYDGMAANKTMWSNDFYNYDYIGAPWPDRFAWINKDEKVGNGGFSFRSARLLDKLRDSVIVFHDDLRHKNEDAVICQGYSTYLKKKHNIKYAPVDVANRFSHEWCNPTGETFGFHGAWNFPLFFDEKTCKEHLLDIPSGHWYSDKLQMLQILCDRKGYKDLWNSLIAKLERTNYGKHETHC